jgi:16S rRNA U1498 N3-methylase RsmE
MIVASDQEATKSLKKRIELIRPILREAATQANQLGLPKETVLQTLAGYLEESNE